MSKNKGGDWAPAYDPCKSYGCALQQCYVDMQRYISRSNTPINDKGWCVEERRLMDQCRSEHNLPGSKPLVPGTTPLPKTNPTCTDITNSIQNNKTMVGGQNDTKIDTDQIIPPVVTVTVVTDE